MFQSANSSQSGFFLTQASPANAAPGMATNPQQRIEESYRALMSRQGAIPCHGESAAGFLTYLNVANVANQDAQNLQGLLPTSGALNTPPSPSAVPTPLPLAHFMAPTLITRPMAPLCRHRA